MNFLLFYLASAVVALIRALPMGAAARAGRFFGGLFYYADARHRGVAIGNLTMCFGAEKSAREIRALALENCKRIGENFFCAAKTAGLDEAGLKGRVEVAGPKDLVGGGELESASSVVVALGHFGNFEIFALVKSYLARHQRATTYRAVRPPGLNRLLMRLRNSSGCLYFERRTEGAELRAALRGNRLLLGLLADQHSGDHGLRLPFLGHECSTSKAPAVFALRFGLPLYAAVCFRTRLAHWRIEFSQPIPTHENGQPRSLADIMLDVNRFFEAAVRRDPANWFWVHNRWKPSRIKHRPAKSSPEDQFGDADEPDDQRTGSARAG